MKNIEVIEAVRNDSKANLSSSNLKWYGRSRTLFYRESPSAHESVSSEWTVSLIKFDGVIFYTDTFMRKSRRHADSGKFNTMIIEETKDNLCIQLNYDTEISFNLRNKVPDNWAILHRIVKKSIPVKDFDLYWEWAWQHPLTSFSKETNDYHIKLENTLSEVSYSVEFKKLKAFFDDINRVNACDCIEEKINLFTSIVEETQQFNNYLAPRKAFRHAPYSSHDYAWDRIRLQVNNPFKSFVDMEDKTLWSRTKDYLKTDTWLMKLQYPENLLQLWPKLIAVFERCELREPQPFGIKFCKDNIKTLAVLFDTADQDNNNPHDWYDYHTSNPVSSEPSNTDYPSTLLA